MTLAVRALGLDWQPWTPLWISWSSSMPSTSMMHLSNGWLGLFCRADLILLWTRDFGILIFWHRPNLWGDEGPRGIELWELSSPQSWLSLWFFGPQDHMWFLDVRVYYHKGFYHVEEYVRRQGIPFGCNLTSMPPSLFLFLSMCCRVNPLNCFSRFCNVDRYCARIGSFVAQSFSFCPVIVLESVFTTQVFTPRSLLVEP